jgi:hypothetical protein
MIAMNTCKCNPLFTANMGVTSFILSVYVVE